MSKFKNSQAGSFLYNLGVSYHGYGVITNDKKQQLFDYFKVDKVTSEQWNKIVEACPHVQLKTSKSEYTPEIVKGLICFPKAAFFRNLKQGVENVRV